MARYVLLLALILAATCTAQSQKVSYSYDDAGRLIKVDYGNGQTISYTYDKAGNLVNSTATSGAGSASNARGKKQKTPPKTESGPAKPGPEEKQK